MAKTSVQKENERGMERAEGSLEKGIPGRAGRHRL